MSSPIRERGCALYFYVSQRINVVYLMGGEESVKSQFATISSKPYLRKYNYFTWIIIGHLVSVYDS